MAIILSLESSSEVCSVSISGTEGLLAKVETTEAFSHTRKMTLFVQECLAEAGLKIKQIDAIAVSDGPGSYTGLRVSASVAKGLCYGLKIPLIAINTLKAIAWQARSRVKAQHYIPMIDARRMEVYTAVFDNDLHIVQETHNLILDGDAYKAYEGVETILCGTGVEKSRHFFESRGFLLMPFDLSSEHMITLAHSQYKQEEFRDLVSYSPNYFKAPKVTKSKKPLF